MVVGGESGMIVAQVLADQHTDDSSQVGPLLTQIHEEIEKVIADGAYDGEPTYQTVAQHGADIEVVIPPQKPLFLIRDHVRQISVTGILT